MTDADNPCVIAGDWLECPAGSVFTFNGAANTLDATLQCPLDSVGQSEFVEASQQGLCQCASSLIPNSGNTNVDGTAAQPMDCDCFACPPGTEFGWAYTCSQPIIANCLTFNCFGQCNGDLNFGLNPETPSPTAAPFASPASTASVTGAAALVLLVALRMIR